MTSPHHPRWIEEDFDAFRTFWMAGLLAADWLSWPECKGANAEQIKHGGEVCQKPTECASINWGATGL